MGNSSSVVYIRTDHSGYSPCDELSGEVCLMIDKPIEASSLRLKIYGVERTKWVQSSIRASQILDHKAKPHLVTERISKDQSGEHYIFNTYAMLKIFDGTINSGQYSFPFSMSLPDNLPGSFIYKSGQYFAQTKYKVKATLISRDCITVLHKSSQEFFILQTPPPISLFKTEKKLSKMLCCVPTLCAKITVSIGHLQYYAGDKVEVKLLIDNPLGISTKNFTISIYKYIQLQNSKGETVKITHQIINKKTEKGIKKKDKNIERLCYIQIPQSASNENTTRGVLSDCQYFIQVEFDGICMAPQVIQTPLIIHQKLKTSQEWMKKIMTGKPNNWKPVFSSNLHLKTPPANVVSHYVWGDVDLRTHLEEIERENKKKIEEKNNNEYQYDYSDLLVTSKNKIEQNYNNVSSPYITNLDSSMINNIQKINENYRYENLEHNVQYQNDSERKTKFPVQKYPVFDEYTMEKNIDQSNVIKNIDKNKKK